MGHFRVWLCKMVGVGVIFAVLRLSGFMGPAWASYYLNAVCENEEKGGGARVQVVTTYVIC